MGYRRYIPAIINHAFHTHRSEIIVHIDLMKVCRSLLGAFLVAGASFFRPSSAFSIILRPIRDFSRVGSISRSYHANLVSLQAKPKQRSVVESYQTISVNCAKCGERLFRYKKKNGTKSNLVKCYVERISEDSAGLLAKQETTGLAMEEFTWKCPSCETQFARSSLIHGRPALKMVGGKVRMTKK